MPNTISPEAKEFLIQSLGKGISEQKTADLIKEKFGESITQQGVHGYKGRKQHGARIKYLSDEWKSDLSRKMAKIWAAQPDNLIKLMQASMQHLMEKVDKNQKLTRAEHEMLIKTVNPIWKIVTDVAPWQGETSGQEQSNTQILNYFGPELTNRIIEITDRARAERDASGRAVESGRGPGGREEYRGGEEEPG